MNTFSRRLLTEAPLIAEGALISMMEGVDFKMAEHPFYQKLRDTMRPQPKFTADNFAVLPITGVLAQKPDPFEMLFCGPMEDTEAIHETFQSLADSESVKGILLDFDSPGGFMTGGPELAELVAATDKKKPVVAFTGGAMASLAYYIGSQARAIVSTSSAHTGSIGVYGTVVDYTKRLEAMGVKVEMFRNKEGDLKGAGVIGTSLTDTQRGHIQAGIDDAFSMFKNTVLSKRPNVPTDAMRGQSFTGEKAKANKLVDVIGSRNSALTLLRKMSGVS